MVGKIIKIIGWFFVGLAATFITFIAFAIYEFITWTGEYDLGEGYKYLDNAPEFIAGPSEESVGGNRENYIQNVPPRVLDYHCDKEHIIVKQNPKDAPLDPWFFPEYGNIYHFNHGKDFDYYWIIDKKEHKICGPYDYEEFKGRCIEMDVKLEFKDRKL